MSFLNRHNPNIKECFQALAQGDAGMFERFFESYKRKVFGIAFKMLKSQTEAEEIVQDVFLSLWQSRERLNHISDPEAYLFATTYNTIYTYLKKASRNQRLLSAIIYRIAQKQNTTEELVAAHDTDKMIQKAIRRLSPQQRTVFELSKQEGLSYNEIAERMQLSQNTVRNHLAIAVKTVRTILEKWAIPFVLGMIIPFR